MSWSGFWSFFFFLSLVLFTALSITVAIGGFFDIRSLFKDLSEARQKAQQSGDDESA